MPAGIRRHLVGKTLINAFHCDSAEIRFVGKIMIIQTFFINQQIECSYIHTYIRTLDNAHNSQARGLNLRRVVSLLLFFILINFFQNIHVVTGYISWLFVSFLNNYTAYCRLTGTQGELMSQNLRPRYDRHFVGITWHNVLGLRGEELLYYTCMYVIYLIA